MKALYLLGIALLLLSCGRNAPDGGPEARPPLGPALQLRAPLGLPPVPLPEDNPVTPRTVALGRKLFYDKRLSGNNTVACASCHDPRLAFTDSRKTSAGMDDKIGKRNAPTILNAAYAPTHFWDGRAASLEDQAGGPMANPLEMNQSHDVAVSKLRADPAYIAEFQKAFGPGPITIDEIRKALAAFERTLLSGNSPFDRYFYGGEKSALSPAGIRGLAVFRDSAKGNCAACHTIGSSFALFSDGQFHNLGVGLDSEGELTDLGRYEETKRESDKGAFKTPTLRNIALTAPYMHDGRLKTLREVVDFYVGGGSSNPYLDTRIRPLNLTGAERADLVAFLESLTGELPADAGPPQ